MSAVNRRVFLGKAAAGVGTAALGTLLNSTAFATATSNRWLGAVNPLHHAAKAKRVIWLTMAGGPSHLETFDYKPELAKQHGQPMPESFTKGQQIAQLQGQKLVCFGPQLPFKKFGQAGSQMCALFEQLGGVADEMCIVRSMTTEAINHDPAHMFMNSGSQITGRPSMGSWVTYGLGSEATNLPAFVVLMSQGQGGQNQPVAARQWSSGFLPSRFQGVQLRGKGDPVLYLTSPPGVTRDRQHDVIEAVNRINATEDVLVGDPEIATRISQYEMAFKMQMSVPELMDTRDEPAEVLKLYGCQPGDGSFGSNCLLARRLAERGVRFIQLYHRDWDHHGGLKQGIEFKAGEVDRPCAALIKDLQRRGMFDDTLIVWAGEFGRTPMSQGGDGRDHHNKGFSIWLAGGGVKRGFIYGKSDATGSFPDEHPVKPEDLAATIYYLLGIEHTKMTYKFQGRDFRLTDVSGSVVKKILA
jgi:hypothetical protein